MAQHDFRDHDEGPFARAIESLARALHRICDSKENLAEILSTAKSMEEGQVKLMGLVEDIQAKIDAIGANVDNIIADEAGLGKQIADLQAQVAAGSPATVAQLQALSDNMTALQQRTQSVADSVPDAPTP
jgi:ABC-type transporter Mla subunit MlaD